MKYLFLFVFCRSSIWNITVHKRNRKQNTVIFNHGVLIPVDAMTAWPPLQKNLSLDT